MKHHPTLSTRSLGWLKANRCACHIPGGGAFQAPTLLLRLTSECGLTIREKERKPTGVVWILYSIFAFTSHAITHYSMAIFRKDAYLVVHLVTSQYGTGDTGFSFRDFHFLDVGQEGGERWTRKQMLLDMLAWCPRCRSLCSVSWGMGALLPVLSMGLWLPFQR